MLILTKHINSIFNSVSYILKEESTKECWIIDIGDYEIIKGIIKEYNLKGVFLTHIHYDHIYGLNKLVIDYPHIPIHTNTHGLKILSNPYDNLSFYHDDDFIFLKPENVFLINENTNLNIGESKISFIETPGHNDSCICILINNFLFTGDSYIPGAKPVTKIAGGNKMKYKDSLVKIFNVMNDNITICPGHESIRQK